MKFKSTILAGMTAILLVTSCDVLNQLGLQPTTAEIIQALQQLLNSSTFKAISQLQKLSSDNPASVLPSEYQSVISTLKTIGLGSEIDKVTKQVGSVSTLVLNESKDIVAESIKQVDFGDAVAIVTGGKDAATLVLKNNMKTVVRNKYAARLDAELNKTDANKYWPMAASAYNLLAKNKVETSLSNMLADKAVDALFLTMGQEEAALRADYKSIGSSVVTKVFDYYTKNQNAPTQNRTLPTQAPTPTNTQSKVIIKPKAKQ